jgi:C-terminal processing protease CtpA/Prc
MKITILIIVLFTSMGQLFGQQRTRMVETKEKESISQNEVQEMVRALADSIAINYIDGEKALMLKEKLLKEIAQGELDEIDDKQTLAKHLTEVLKKWSNDMHFNIVLAGQRRMMPSSYDHYSDQNYFFEKMEHLKGNIAYVKFDRFIPPKNAGSLVVSAMLFAANSNAIIIDLRNNMGGSPKTVGLLAGFFVENHTLLNINDIRSTGGKYETYSVNTDVTINNADHEISTDDLEKLKNIPVYILTSDYTFSAAEMFCSSLQGYNRATVVGEKTGGGGHGIRPFTISQGFQAFIPFMRSYHPVTKEGWEVSGIQPDIPSSASDALRVAQISILKELQKNSNRDTRITEYLKELEAQVDE